MNSVALRTFFIFFELLGECLFLALCFPGRIIVILHFQSSWWWLIFLSFPTVFSFFTCLEMNLLTFPQVFAGPGIPAFLKRNLIFMQLIWLCVGLVGFLVSQDDLQPMQEQPLKAFRPFTKSPSLCLSCCCRWSHHSFVRKDQEL